MPRTPTSSSRRSWRPTKCSPAPSAASSTTVTASRASRAAASCRPRSTWGASRISSRRSSATTCSPPAAAAGGEPMSAPEVTIELAEAAQGVTRSIAFQVATTCETCHGGRAGAGNGAASAARSAAAWGGCSTCRAPPSASSSAPRRAHACGGMGSVIETPCPTCDGAGRTIAERAVDVAIPAGIHDGQRIRISGRGSCRHAGRRCGRRLRARSGTAGSALRP